MASEHSYSRDTMVLERDSVALYADITIGASGAVTTAKGGGIASVVKQATAGQYNVVLDSQFNKLLYADATTLGSVTSGVSSVQLLQAPDTISTSIKTTGPLVIQCYDAAGAAVNPASGTVIKLKLDLRRTSVGPFD